MATEDSEDVVKPGFSSKGLVSTENVSENLLESSRWALIAIPSGDASTSKSSVKVKMGAHDGKVKMFFKMIRIMR
jgi:hypothetical protein